MEMMGEKSRIFRQMTIGEKDREGGRIDKLIPIDKKISRPHLY